MTESFTGALSPEVRAKWQRVLRDLRPSAVLHAVERVKPALGARWLARAMDVSAADAYAERWHQAGWSPAEWWELAASVQLASGSGYARELKAGLVPWPEWRELAALHGPVTAAIALSADPELELDTRVFWAKAERKLSKPGFGTPVEARAE